MSLLSEHEKAWGNPPIFDQYEFYIQLADEREESRISALLTQYNGKIALQKGRKSTTHVIVDCLDATLEAHDWMVQVTPDWVRECITTQELVREANYKPLDNVTRKRKSISLLNEETEKKQRKDQDLELEKRGETSTYFTKYGITWFYSKQVAKDHYLPLYGSDAFWVKLGNKMFAALQSRDAFIEYCVEMYQQAGFLPPLYELVHGENPRLYVDIEIEYEQLQDTEVMSAVIKTVLQIIRRKITELTQCSERLLETVDTANHRWKSREVDGKEMWTLSAHIIFPMIRFEHNDRGMKSFMKVVDTELQQHDNLMWKKKCKIKWELRTAVDQRTYMHEQAFRLLFTSKNYDKAHLLLPYDLQTDEQIVPQTPEEVKVFLSRAIISRADPTDCVIISDKQVSAFLGESSVELRERSVPSQTANERTHHVPASADERAFVENQVLPNLDRKRYSETQHWLKIGYGLSSVFGGDDAGLILFKKWSSTAGNYDDKKCAEVYSKSNGTIGFGSFCVWLKEDGGELGRLLFKKFLQQQDDARFAEPEEELDLLLQPRQSVSTDEKEEELSFLIHQAEENGQYGYGQIFIYLVGDNVKISNKKGDCFIFSEVVQLWKERPSVFLISKITEVLLPAMHRIMDKIRDLTENDIELQKKRIGQLEKDKKRITSSDYCRGILQMIIPGLWSSDFLSKLNREPFFPVQDNKVVDLRTGEVVPRTKAHMFSFSCPVSLLDETHPLENARRFFAEMMCHDQDMIEYFQVINGLFLTPEMPDREGPYIPWGCGSNAKGTWAAIKKKIMQEFYVQADSKVFMQSDVKQAAAAHTAHLIPLVNCRLVMCSEVGQGNVLAKQLIAGWTGGDPISARACGGDQFQFQPQAKICLQTNHKPNFDASDKAMTDRVRLIPCLARFTDDPVEGESKKDRKFAEQLLNEYLNEVFTFNVRGAVKFYAAGKKTPSLPEKMKEAQQEYFEDNDPVQNFIDSRCTVKKNSPGKEDSINRTVLYAAYQQWCHSSNAASTMLPSTDFYAILSTKGFQPAKTKGERCFKGIQLATSENK